MPQIDFYILADASIEQRLLFGCRLAEKAFKLGHSLYLHCTDSQQGQLLDDLLWRFQSSSFLPHSQQANAPVQIGWGPFDRDASNNEGTDNTVLINLSLSVPPFFDRFQRITEIVVQAPEVLDATRNAWRFYQQQQCALDRHDLRKGN